MERDVLLKKNIIGGFDKKQVLEYITQLQDSCDDRKVKNEINELRSRVELLRGMISERDREIASLTHRIDDATTVELPSGETGYDILKRSAAKIDEARERAEEITDKISENIAEKSDNISALFQKLTSINQTLTTLSGNLSGLSDKMENVPFEPVTERDVNTPTAPTFDFDKVSEKVASEQSKLTENQTEKTEETAKPPVPSPVKEKPSQSPEEKEDKLNILFARLVEMTDEINRVQSSISDVSEKIDRIPEEKAVLSHTEESAEAEPEKIDELPIEETVPSAEISITEDIEEPTEEETENEEPIFPASIEVISIEEEEPAEVPIKSADEDTDPKDDGFDDIFDDFEIETPDEDSIIKSAIENFKAQSAKRISHAKPEEDKKAETVVEKPEIKPAEDKKSEEIPEAKTPVADETKPTESPVDKKDSANSNTDGGFEESLYFTLDF